MITDTISHEEATIQSYMRDPAFAEFMLQDAIAEGDTQEAEKIQRRINEAKARQENSQYWQSVIDNARKTANTGYNLENVILLVSKALAILKGAEKVSA